MAPVYQFWDELYRALSSLRAPLNFTSKSRDGAKLYTYRHVQTFKGAFSIISDPKINHYQRAQLVYKELYFKTGLRMRCVIPISRSVCMKLITVIVLMSRDPLVSRSGTNSSRMSSSVIAVYCLQKTIQPSPQQILPLYRPRLSGQMASSDHVTGV